MCSCCAGTWTGTQNPADDYNTVTTSVLLISTTLVNSTIIGNDFLCPVFMTSHTQRPYVGKLIACVGSRNRCPTGPINLGHSTGLSIIGHPRLEWILISFLFETTIWYWDHFGPPPLGQNLTKHMIKRKTWLNKATTCHNHEPSQMTCQKWLGILLPRWGFRWGFGGGKDHETIDFHSHGGIPSSLDDS